MATAVPITDGSEEILLVWSKFTTESIPFSVTKVFLRLLLLNRYVCQRIPITDIFLLIIPRADLEELLNDPVYKFPQVEVIYVYYDNNESFERDQAYFGIRYGKLRFCHERNLIKELDKPTIDNAVHSSREIDRTAINSFASSVTQRISAKRPTTTSHHSPAQQLFSSAPLHGFSVKNIEQIDSRFICPTCRFIFREPYQLGCGHRICQSCINVENDKMSCLTCSKISSSKNIWLDKGFRKEMEKLLISCAICDWTEHLKLYQEHIEQDHQEHVNQRDQLNILASLCSTLMLSNNDLPQNSLSQIQNSITILSNCVNVLNNDQQRIRDAFSSNQSLLRIVSEELSCLRPSSEDNISFANGMTIINDFNCQEVWSLKQKIEDRSILSFDGTFLWKITDIQKKMTDAQSERQKSIYSPPFYSSHTGYKMCVRLYLNGDGDVRDTHLSVFLVLMKGDFDAILHWPFTYRVTFYLFDQSTLGNNQRNISNNCWPDTTLPCFQCPVSDMNEAYGIKKFFPLELLQQNRNLYIQDDVMFIKIETDFITERPVSVGTSGTGATANDDGHVDTTGENMMHIS